MCGLVGDVNVVLGMIITLVFRNSAGSVRFGRYMLQEDDRSRDSSLIRGIHIVINLI